MGVMTPTRVDEKNESNAKRERKRSEDNPQRLHRLPSMVTRFGEFSTIGQFFSLGSFYKNYKSSPTLGYWVLFMYLF
jgi:hypothetical protein